MTVNFEDCILVRQKIKNFRKYIINHHMFYNMENWTILLWVWGLGLCGGSFVTMAGFRLSRSDTSKTSWYNSLWSRSHCPKCQRVLPWYSLFPLFSWLWQRGKCVSCRQPISFYYPLTEVITSALFVLIYWKYGPSWITLILWIACIQLLILAIVDLYTYTFPDSLQVILAILGLGFFYFSHGGQWQYMWIPCLSALLQVLLGLALSYGFLWCAKKPGLGLGDVKFFGVAGCFLGFSGPTSFYFLAGCLGIIFSLLWRKLTQNRYFPFGPALVAALFLCIMWPDILPHLLG